MFNLDPTTLIIRAIVLLLAVVVHEYAHAYIAYRMGDPTAKEQGRMTLDPRANVYWPGFIIGVLIGFAILGSAPVNPARMRDPRWGMFWAVLAGPVSNLLLAVPFALALRFGLVTPGMGGLYALFLEMIFLNVLLFVFNLLPLAPLDGWTVVLSALPPGPAIWWQRQRQISTYIMFGLIGLSFLLPSLLIPGVNLAVFNPLTWLVLRPAEFIIGLLVGV